MLSNHCVWVLFGIVVSLVSYVFGIVVHVNCMYCYALYW